MPGLVGRIDGVAADPPAVLILYPGEPLLARS